MYFTAPVWNSSKNLYKVAFLPSYDFEYSEYRETSSGNLTDPPNESSEKFNTIIISIANTIYNEGSNWFSSPIKQSVFLKRVRHTYSFPTDGNNYGGNMLRVVFSPTTLFIKANIFEIHWTTRFENYTETHSDNIEYSEDLTQAEPTRTIVIQSHPADIEILENEDIPFDNLPSELELSSRAIQKKRVREARLKAAVATMKAEQMVEKYFRRYGTKINTDFDSDSDLSFESEEEDSE
uniref:Uncharacterized protein n=1 Tax=viral metagenome TaxID=1070528 RepID=A0A6C0D8H6_9ZZZZ